MVPEAAELGSGQGDRAAILSVLDKILASRPFRSSSQCSTLLCYVVEHTLAGEDHLLRERVVGAELFGRSADYQTSEDLVVRLRVAEVRKRLAQYYLSEENASGFQIEIPSGAYKATFRSTADGSMGTEKPLVPSDTDFATVAFEEVSATVAPVPTAEEAENASDIRAIQVLATPASLPPESPSRPFLGKPASLGAVVLLVLAAVSACGFAWVPTASEIETRAHFAPKDVSQHVSALMGNGHEPAYSYTFLSDRDCRMDARTGAVRSIVAPH